MKRDVVIVGAGLAGSRCAETLRARGFAGRIRLVGEEAVPPYERPALSKELLAGKKPPEQLGLRDPSWWKEAGIELVLGSRVEGLRPDKRRAVLASGKELHWDALVLATGSKARRIPTIPDLLGIYRLRTLADALTLRDELRPGRRLAIVGAGFVGTEVASTASKLGVAVTLIDPALPLSRVLGSEVGGLLADRYRDHGVVLRAGVVAGLETGPDGRVSALRLQDGSAIACDALLVAVGAEPAGEVLDGGSAGIETDELGRTKVPGIYACGDVAAAWHPLLRRRVRVEHWTDAAVQGAAVAHAILCEDPPPRPLPYFWSDQFGLRLQYVGSATDWDSIRLDGHPDEFKATYLSREGRPLAALLANRPRELGPLRHELAAAA
jgi:3-phenylpropionate/trans-cinnamate dioxygenase ferredoxin reductase component